MTDLGEMNRFLVGIEVTRDRKARAIRLNQERYIGGVLQRFGMENCKPMKTPLPTRPNLEVYAEDVLYGDNRGPISLTKNPENHQRTKHIDVQYHFARARVESHEIAVEYIPTADMTADIFTKSLEWIKHERHMRGMGLVSGN